MLLVDNIKRKFHQRENLSKEIRQEENQEKDRLFGSRAVLMQFKVPKIEEAFDSRNHLLSTALDPIIFS